MDPDRVSLLRFSGAVCRQIRCVNLELSGGLSSRDKQAEGKGGEPVEQLHDVKNWQCAISDVSRRVTSSSRGNNILLSDSVAVLCRAAALSSTVQRRDSDQPYFSTVVNVQHAPLKSLKMVRIPLIIAGVALADVEITFVAFPKDFQNEAHPRQGLAPEPVCRYPTILMNLAYVVL